MTISSTTRLAGPFTGTGGTATFPFSFKVFEKVDLYVVTLTVATGAIAQLALTTDYTVLLNSDQDTTPGGNVVLNSNLASGLQLTISTDIPELQGLDLANAGAFYPDVINAALDLLTVLIQQLQVQASRAIKVPITDAALAALPAAAERADTLLGFDANGNVALYDLNALPASPYPLTLTDATVFGTMTGARNGSNMTFGLRGAPTGEGTLIYNGLTQLYGVDYSVSGSTLTTHWAPVSSDVLIYTYPVAPMTISTVTDSTALGTMTGALNGSNMAFGLSEEPAGIGTLCHNGLTQLYGVDYTVSGTTLTTTFAPISSDVLFYTYPV